VTRGFKLMNIPCSPEKPTSERITELHREYDLQPEGIQAFQVAQNCWQFFMAPKAILGFSAEVLSPQKSIKQTHWM